MPLLSEKVIQRAIANVSAFGDTDVFPFPFENWFIKDSPPHVSAIVQYMDENFASVLDTNPPQFESTLAPAGYAGFRWVTSIDPFWNLYLLSLVISIGPEIEAARISAASNTVFSYRYVESDDEKIFQDGIGWSTFMDRSYTLSSEFKFVVATDISEFYRRINHHRLENALQHIDHTEKTGRIIRILDRFSQKSSYGLPIGGPAARLLSELTINQIDKLLLLQKINFVRFADDYHLFTNSIDQAYSALQFLSHILITNQGLTLQKSKTRIMTSHEFQQSFPKHLLPGPIEADNMLEADTIKLLKLSISYDPYSSTAHADYEALKSELGQIDIVGLLTAEAQKSQINVSLARRIVAVIKHLEPSLRAPAIATLLENKEQFFPIMANVLQMIYDVSKDSDPALRQQISALLRSAISSQTHVFGIDLHLAYAVRVLSESGSEEDMLLLSDLYEKAPPFLRRDIVLVYAKSNYWYPLSNLKSKYASMTPWEQRAFYLASYTLGDEGNHWRESVKAPNDPIQKLFRTWCSSLKTGTSTLIRL